MQLTRRHFLQTSAALAASGSAKAANDKIQIGVIGCGARSHELMKALFDVPGTEIVGVVDAYKGRVERALDRTDRRAKAYKSYKELLAQPSIDAVLVVTPDHWHSPMVLDAMAAGKDVYCEKPLTYRASEGPELIAAARKHSRILQVGSQGVSSLSQAKAREMIQGGKLGQVTMIRAAYNRNTASGAWIYPIPPDASPETVDWSMFLGSA
ncbi:MAG: Gfo/Idh/MocA family protein, partial [Bryobacteraceae bacterium]